MSASMPIPVPRVLDVESVGVCGPDSVYCDVPDLRAEASERTDEADPATEDAEG